MRFQGIKIKDITYKNTEFAGEYEEDKKVILDLYCINQKGEHFLIEAQRAEQEYFKKRPPILCFKTDTGTGRKRQKMGL